MSAENPQARATTSGSVRRATEADIARILEIEHASFPTPWPAALLRSQLDKPGFLVYEEGGRLVGYIIATIRMPSLFTRLEERTRAWLGQPVAIRERAGHIMNLAIDPSRRGRGIATLLLQRALSHLSGADAVRAELEVRIGNEAAIQLYRKHGFEIERRIPHYYRGGDDAYLMSRRL